MDEFVGKDVKIVYKETPNSESVKIARGTVKAIANNFLTIVFYDGTLKAINTNCIIDMQENKEEK